MATGAGRGGDADGPHSVRHVAADNSISYHGEIIYGDTRWIEDDCPATFSISCLLNDFSLVDRKCRAKFFILDDISRWIGLVNVVQL